MNFANYTASGEPVPEGNGPSSPFLPSNPTILAADCPLIVPMQLKISLMRLRAIVVLIISRSTGVTISFKTDPLESVLVSSTFDSLPSVRRHLQTEIENRLRDLFQKELPAMIHSLSNDWLKRKGLNKRTEDSRDTIFTSSSPESVSAMFPVPTRAFSPPSMSGKQSAPPPHRAKTGKSQKSIIVSVTAQSAPAELAQEDKLSDYISEPLGVVALVSARESEIQNISQSFDLVPSYQTPPRQFQTCFSEIGFNSFPIDQYYFKSNRGIISRAPTDLALPDPVLIKSGIIFKKKSINVSKFFKSLFKINEIEGDESENSCQVLGLRAIEDIGIGIEVSVSGLSSVKSSLIIPDNVSIRSRSRSTLIDPLINKALSTISGNRYSKYNNIINNNTNQITVRSETDPDLVQFEPDEFRSSDYVLRTSSTKMNHSLLNSRTYESVNGDSKNLAVKFGIMRKLQSTLATNNFVESNIFYRTQSSKMKK